MGEYSNGRKSSRHFFLRIPPCRLIAADRSGVMSCRKGNAQTDFMDGCRGRSPTVTCLIAVEERERELVWELRRIGEEGMGLFPGTVFEDDQEKAGGCLSATRL